MPKSAIREVSVQENLLTTDQVAKYLKVDKFTVYRLVTQKKIPAFKVGNQWRFKRQMIDAWLQENSNLRD
ncbi:MAG TPA: helix-turn-helix domain-containing protein [Candidatus Binatia bacterium]|nr:helix-turn-helix domain-containing protein [Candidatus Binatia bacterium]